MARPRPSDWRRRYATVDPRQYEVIGAPLFDQSQTYTSATTTQINFFSTVPGNKFLGNIQIAQQLPAGISFNIYAVRFITFLEPFSLVMSGTGTVQTGLADDLFKLYTQGYFSLSILNKLYLECPLWMLAPGAGLFGNAIFGTAAAGAAAQFSNWGSPDPRSVHTLAQPIVIPPQTNFNPIATWPNGAVTLSGQSPVRVGLVLDGEVIRPKQ